MLRSKEWFYKQCLLQVGQHDRLCHLAWDILQKGVGQKDATRGHVTQAIGASQQFLIANPAAAETIRAADPTSPFNVRAHPRVRRALVEWLREQHDHEYGRASFGFNYGTLKNILTPSLGGRRHGGGGGDDEFKRVLRIMADLIP